jgi:prepilin-type N-terminal cleavage/methylation domain-containing protein
MTSGSEASRAFTLIELMLVIALIAIVFIGSTPLVSASLRERKLRSAAESIADAVRDERAGAMAAGERRVAEIRPGGIFERDRKKDRKIFAAPRGVEVAVRMPGRQWGKPDGQDWEFSPIGLVTPLSLRLSEGKSWIEVDFDLLTGRVADERYAF